MEFLKYYNEQAILTLATTKIALLPGETIMPGANNFWLGFLEADVTQNDDYTRNGATSLAAHFAASASNAQKTKFTASQTKLIDKLDADLLAVTPSFENALAAIREKYGLKGAVNAFRIHNYIRNHPEKFGQDAPFHNPIFNGIYNFEQTVMDAVKIYEPLDRNALGLAIASSTDRAYSWDMKTGQAKQLIHEWLSPEKASEIYNIMAANRDGKKKKTTISALSAQDPSKVKPTNRLNEVLSEETQHPKRDRSKKGPAGSKPR